MQDFRDFIEVNSEIRFGQPRIKGTRISVYDVLKWLANGMTKKDIIMDYPELDEIKINACLYFAMDRTKFHAVA